jgi:hypothetical protein
MRSQGNIAGSLSQPWPPRYLRLRSAAKYLGMSKGVFMSMVQPRVAAFPVGWVGAARRKSTCRE